jgi:hypothetical protein
MYRRVVENLFGIFSALYHCESCWDNTAAIVGAMRGSEERLKGEGNVGYAGLRRKLRRVRDAEEERV